MERSKASSGDTQLFWLFLLSVAGYVAYRQFLGVDLNALVHSLTLGATVICGAIIAVLWAVFAFKGRKDEKYQRLAKTLTHLIAFTTVGVLVYRVAYFPVDFTDAWFLTHAGIVLLTALYYAHQLHIRVYLAIQNHKQHNSYIRNQHEEIAKIFALDPAKISALDLLSISTDFKSHKYLDKSLRPFKKDYDKKLAEIEHQLTLKIRQDEIDKINEKKEIAKNELREVQESNKHEQLTKEHQQQRLTDEILREDKNVYALKNLDGDTINILQKNMYRKISEYDVLEHKNIDVLVRPVLNHSHTHIFLVWSIIRLLESKFKGVSNIKEHETRDADITFQYQHKTYSIEVETGNLLKKKAQLIAKVEYLNKKYSKRWFFVVSNKNLQSAYRKYGVATPRNGVEKTLVKMLNFATPQ